MPCDLRSAPELHIDTLRNIAGLRAGIADLPVLTVTNLEAPMEDRLQPLVRRFRALSTVPFLFSPGAASPHAVRVCSRLAPLARVS